MSETYNNDIIFKTRSRIYYTIPVYNYTMYYDTVQYITIQFSVLNSHTAQYTTTICICTVYIQFQYYSTTVTVTVYCIQSADSSVLYNTYVHYFTLHVLYCRHYISQILKITCHIEIQLGPCY